RRNRPGTATTCRVVGGRAAKASGRRESGSAGEGGRPPSPARPVPGSRDQQGIAGSGGKARRRHPVALQCNPLTRVPGSHTPAPQVRRAGRRNRGNRGVPKAALQLQGGRTSAT